MIFSSPFVRKRSHPALPYASPLGVLVLLFLSVTSVKAQQTLLTRNYDKTGQTRIEVQSVFSPAIARGFIPVQVTIRNATPVDRTWNIEFNFDASWGEMNYRSNFSVPADAGEETIKEILVPAPTAISSGSSYRQMSSRASSAGLPSENQTGSYNISTDWPTIGISKEIADRNMNRLNTEVNSRAGGRTDSFGMIYDPDILPGDWRGYTGIDLLMITDEEWQTVSPGARLAILEWVRLGGRLDLYTRKPKPATALIDEGFLEPGASGDKVERGLGKIFAWKWDGEDLEANKIYNRYREFKNLAEGLANEYRRDWPLLRSFGTKSFNAILVVLLLIAFGIVVGPINLFVLAKPGQRHRLFITTPIISLVASLLILALILLSDGIGGSGNRRVLANLEPGATEKRLYVVQEQICRTGVLLGSGFRIPEAVFLSPVMLPDSQWNRLDTSNSPIATYSLNGDTYRGDWFQSRSEQGHFLQAVRPTRSRIELQKDSPDGETPPTLFSSLEFTLDEFYYKDKAGVVWKAKNESIGGGQEISLEKVDSKDFEKWWAEQTGPFSRPLRAKTKKLTKERDHFFAVSTDEEAGFLETLGAIRWKQDTAIVHGSVLAAGSLPNVDAEPAEEPEAKQ